MRALLLLAAAVLYATGVRAARAQAGRTSAFGPWPIACFAAGLASLATAELSPLARLSDVLFSAHMTQHEILMLIAAPLLVMGQPLLAALWAVPARHRSDVARWFRRPLIARAWHLLTGPTAVLLLHAIALWIWHIPSLFEGALAHDGVHFVQHLSFLGTASLFWWSIVYGRYGRLGYGVALLYVFLTALHNTILGALLTIAPTAWYSTYELTAAGQHIDALADQQLAGLIMWVPSGVVFLVLGLALASAWLGESERRVLLGSTTLPRPEGRQHAP
jgi:putative membrane protein